MIRLINISDIGFFSGISTFSNRIKSFENFWNKYDKYYNECIIELENKVDIKKQEIKKLFDNKETLKMKYKNKEIDDNFLIDSLKKIEKEQIVINNIIEMTSKHRNNLKLTSKELLLNDIDISHIEDDNIEIKEKEIITKQKIEKLNKTNKEKNEISKLANQLINRDLGIKNEKTAINMYEIETNSVLDTSQKYYKKNLINNYFIGGRMDGIDINNKIIIEIKNRKDRFFNQVKEYEYVQIQMYMYLHDYNHGKLVEKFKDKIKIIDVNRNDSYIDNTLEKLKTFSNNFDLFLKDKSLKIKYINLTNEKDKEYFFDRYLLDTL